MLRRHQQEGHGPEEHVHQEAGDQKQPLEDDDSINRDTDEDHDGPAGRKEQPLEDDDSINRDTDEDHDEPAGRKEQPLEDDDSINRDTDEDHDEPAGRKEQPLEDFKTTTIAGDPRGLRLPRFQDSWRGGDPESLADPEPGRPGDRSRPV